MKKLKILFGTVILSAGLASCSSAYYASAGYASDDLYAVHDRAEISRRKQAEAEAQRAAAEARRAEWEARIAEAKAAAAENSYYEYRSADANPYESVLADDYESAYARRLRGFESPTYKPSRRKRRGYKECGRSCPVLRRPVPEKSRHTSPQE